MTYRELMMSILRAPPEVLDQDVSVYINGKDEYMPLCGTDTEDGSGNVLDEGHLFLVV